MRLDSASREAHGWLAAYEDPSVKASASPYSQQAANFLYCLLENKRFRDPKRILEVLHLKTTPTLTPRKDLR